MKKIIIVISFIVLIGCAASSERMRADDFYGKGEYIHALRSYELALSQSRIDAQRNDIQQRIEETKVKIVDDVLKWADTVYTKTDPPSLASIDEAVVILKGAAADDRWGRVSSQITAYQEAKKNIIKREAENLNAKGEYFNALAVYQKARAIDPDDKEVADQITRLTAYIEKEKKSSLTEIAKLLKAGNGRKAKTICDNLLLINPDDPELKELNTNISDVFRRQVLSEAKGYKSQNKFFNAYTTLKEAGIEGLEEEIHRIGKEGGSHYFTKAEKYLNEGQMHLAYIASVKALALSPNDIQISQLHKTCADVIDTEIQKYIAILTFGSPANHPDYGMLFSDMLITRLFNELPYGINIVEKEKINLLKDTNKMKIKNIGGSLGADYIINGNVSLFKVDDVVSETMATAKVKVGEEVEANPEYDKMVKTYGDNPEKWPYQPEMNIRKDKYEMIKYKKGTHSRKAFGNVSVRLFDASDGAILFAKDFEDSMEKKDYFQDMVEVADIPYDPLELPSDTEIKAELRNAMLNNISKAIFETLQDREKRFLRWAVLHNDRNEYMKAIKSLAQGHVFCDKSNTNNEDSKKIFNMMIALTEIE